MKSLSISAAWEETRAILARDGRLFLSVALALIALPTAVNGLVNPRGMSSSSTPLWVDCVALVASAIVLAGQLALIRLALGPSITVGGAIAHGIRRMPIYLLAVLLIIVGFVIVAIPLVFLLGALGVPIQRQATSVPLTPATAVVSLFYVAVVCFIGVRLILSLPVASAEAVGPVAILKHSWRLTAGNWWPLFGFLLIFMIGAIILLVAVGSAAGVAISLLLGPIQPMSGGALVLALVQALVSAAITGLFAVMLARIYLQLARRSEPQAGVPSSGI